MAVFHFLDIFFHPTTSVRTHSACSPVHTAAIQYTQSDNTNKKTKERKVFHVIMYQKHIHMIMNLLYITRNIQINDSLNTNTLFSLKC